MPTSDFPEEYKDKIEELTHEIGEKAGNLMAILTENGIYQIGFVYHDMRIYISKEPQRYVDLLQT